eukprot:gnl/Spiro4/21624_TR10590_c1_g1_i1.p1 gnl/Spiro4/21624_TR10590_c1_g1~~gnl/Spiro4/21624_TR10590_c1_g1_i1.p1  ORF type:complete len:603 (-),score=150.00 gnl/Spiro4/21624_TR10590_c1_g1_i1:56-1834(-)
MDTALSAFSKILPTADDAGRDDLDWKAYALDAKRVVLAHPSLLTAPCRQSLWDTVCAAHAPGLKRDRFSPLLPFGFLLLEGFANTPPGRTATTAASCASASAATATPTTPHTTTATTPHLATTTPTTPHTTTATTTPTTTATATTTPTETTATSPPIPTGASVAKPVARSPSNRAKPSRAAPPTPPPPPLAICISPDVSPAELQEHVQRALDTSTVPPVLPCRSAQIAAISEVLSNCVVYGMSGSAFISGSPGTGKTVCVQHALAELRRTSGKRHTVVWINAMNLRRESLWLEIYKGFGGLHNKNADSDGRETLEQLVKNATLPLVLVVDEVDRFGGKGEDVTVFCRLFALPCLKDAHIVVIGISNAVSLMAQLPRLQNLTHQPKVIEFEPYGSAELVQITRARLAGIPYEIEPPALNLCALKIEKVTGDCRKLLDLLRDAVSRAPNSKTCKIEHASAAVSSKFGLTYIDRIQNLPDHAQLILCAAVVLHRRTKKANSFTLDDLLQQYRLLCQHDSLGRAPVDFSVVWPNLEASGVLEVGARRNRKIVRVLLKAPEQDVRDALNACAPTPPHRFCRVMDDAVHGKSPMLNFP